MPSHDQHSGKSKSIAASVATGGKGNVAYSRPKPVLDTKNTPAQFISEVQTNTKTKRTFRIIYTKGRIDAIQVKGDPVDVHQGHLIYQEYDDSVFLKTIVSDPESGSGIGSLLMYALAEYAMSTGKPKITIGVSSLMAVSFYELLGFKTDMAVKVKEEEDRLMNTGKEKGDALIEYSEALAKAAYDSDPQNRRTATRFEDLSDKKREQLTLAKLQEIQRPSRDPGKNLRYWMHAKAAAPRGFTADTTEVAAKAASLCKSWVDDKGSGVGLDVKLGDEKKSTTSSVTTSTATTDTATTSTATTSALPQTTTTGSSSALSTATTTALPPSTTSSSLATTTSTATPSLPSTTTSATTTAPSSTSTTVVDSQPKSGE